MRKKLLILLTITFILVGCSRDDLPKNMEIVIDKSQNIEYIDYENEYIFTRIPSTWTVEVYPTDVSHYTFKIYDKENEDYLVFFNLKTEGFTKTYEDRNNYINENPSLIEAKLPTLENKTSSNYYSMWNEVAKASDITIFKIPKLNDITITEVISKDDKNGDIITASFKNSEGKNMTGIFSANIIENEKTLNVVNTIFLVSPVEDFMNYKGVLASIILNLKFKSEFIEKLKDDEFTNDTYKDIASTMIATYDNKSSSYAIEEQKQSDIDLGYIRVYNTKTNNIYKTSSDFFDYYDKDIYIKVSDDMYLKPITGFIKID